MKQESRVILAVALSVLILVVYYRYLAPPPPVVSTPTPVSVTPIGSTPQTSDPDSPGGPTSPSIKPDAKETKALHQDIFIETAKTRVVLSTTGGRISSYQLKDYHLTPDASSEALDFFSPAEHTYAAGLTLSGDVILTDDKIFEVADDKKQQNGVREIKLEWHNSRIRVTKTFVFGTLASPYGVTLHTEIENLSDQNLNLTTALTSRLAQKDPPAGGVLGFLKQQNHNPYYGQMDDNGKLHSEHALEKITEHWPVHTALRWSGITDRYFIHAIMPVSQAAAQLRFDNAGGPVGVSLFGVNQPLPDAGKTGPVDHGCLTSRKCLITLDAGAKITADYQIYTGPRLSAELTAVSPLLGTALDYGWFDMLARPILKYMLFLHRFVPNWGLVIILLTFTIKLILHPVNKKSFASMKAMQLLQPKLEEIKKRYPNDPQKQQQETMQLFRTHKVSPLGCLPMFLQLPVYIALYRVLWGAPEFYHAPFFGFYRDLSAPDPYFILPVLLTVFFVLQQMLTPSASADPAQKRMMMLMPLIFAVFMFFLPVGLVLYILVNTATSVIQQFMMKRDLSFMDLFRGNWKAKEA